MFEVVRLRSLMGSRLPSVFRICDAWSGWRGTLSFRAIGFRGAFGPPCCKLVVELDFEPDVLAPLKSTVRALCEPLAGGGSGLPLPIFLTSTQSGSGLGVNGLLGRFGLGK